MDTVTRAMTERTLNYGLGRGKVNRDLLGGRIQIPVLQAQLSLAEE